VHTVGAFLFIALLARQKLGHIVISTLNIYFGNLDNEKPAHKYTSELIDPETFETADSFGASRVQQFTWKDLMDLDACTRCGRCQDQCPAWLTGKPLSPKKLIIDLKAHLDAVTPVLLTQKTGAPVASAEPLIGGTVKPETFWSCTHCAACMEACPVNIAHVPKITELRKHQVLMEGKMPAALQKALTHMENHFNPYGFEAKQRGAWIPAELNIQTLAQDPQVDYLYFGGCSAAYDARSQKTAIALLRLLTLAGYKVGILGGEEVCCGDSALRAGNDYLFQSLAATNLQSFQRYGVNKIVTTCPRGYNVLKKEYNRFSQMGLDADGNTLEYNLSVYHHVEIIAQLIETGRLKLNNHLHETITYHDSCFLGRYNEIYAEPRNILAAIPGARTFEMAANRAHGFCCGAGGSRIWQGEELDQRISHTRVKHAQATGAGKIATACPFCMTMLCDGIKDLDIQNLEAVDLAELVLSAVASQND
jgi:Fe-S oxidoreductase